MHKKQKYVYMKKGEKKHRKDNKKMPVFRSIIDFLHTKCDKNKRICALELH